MDHSLLFFIGLFALLLGNLLAQCILDAPRWLSLFRSWLLAHKVTGQGLPYPSLLLFFASQIKPSLARMSRLNQGVRDRSELQGWAFWDEPFERALQCILVAVSFVCAGLIGLLSGLEPLLTLMLAGLCGLAAWFDPPRRLQARDRKAKELCLDGMPALLDGVVIALEAGQSLNKSLEASLSRGFREDDRAWVGAIRQSLEDIKRGLGVEPAFLRLRRVLAIPVIHRFAASCVLSETQGQSIAGVLKRQSEQCRREAQMEMEKRALQAPVKLMAPLMICIFPCTFVVLLAPLSKALLSVSGGTP
jgi:tight adherence protein C